MIEPLDGMPAGAIGFRLSGVLHDEDYKSFVPAVDRAIAEAGGKVGLLAEFHDFKGWDAAALWDDVKFATTHCANVSRVALVGEATRERLMATVCKPFTMAEVKYFDAGQLDEAKAWVGEAP